MSTSDANDRVEAKTAAGTQTADDLGDVATVLRGRADSYRMFSRLFLKPLSEADIEELTGIDYTSVAHELGDRSLLSEGFRDMGSFLKRRHSGTRQQLSTDYTMCFDGVTAVDEQVATPYASVFLGEKALLYQRPRQEVLRVFQAENITLSGTVKIPEDHLSFELEFLAILSDRATAALEQGNSAEALRNLELSRSFINEHILSWFDLLKERAENIVETRFYRGVLKATRGYLDLDLKTLEDLIEVVGDGRD
jgi:TorA maturation chaperone TorD